MAWPIEDPTATPLLFPVVSNWAFTFVITFWNGERERGEERKREREVDVEGEEGEGSLRSRAGHLAEESRSLRGRGRLGIRCRRCVLCALRGGVRRRWSLRLGLGRSGAGWDGGTGGSTAGGSVTSHLVCVCERERKREVDCVVAVIGMCLRCGDIDEW